MIKRILCINYFKKILIESRKYLLLLLLFISACTSNSTEVEKTVQPTSISDVASYQQKLTEQALIDSSVERPENNIKELTPYCANPDSPQPITDLQEFAGEIIFLNSANSQLYTFGGFPPAISKKQFSGDEIDKIEISPDWESMIAYKKQPHQIEPDKSTFFLFSKNESKQVVQIDLSEMSNFVRNQLAPTYSFQTWSLSWVTNQVIRIDATYSETPSMGFPLHVYNYYDLKAKIWWPEVLEKIPNREKFAWTDSSSDLHYVLYVTNDNHLALWDHELAKVVWEEPYISSYQTRFITQWSPDSKFVAIGGLPEVRILAMHDLTAVTIHPTQSSIANKEIITDGAVLWSPDSHFLAIMATEQDINEKTWQPFLYIFNVYQGEMIFQCPLLNQKDTAPDKELLWSPDGKFLIQKGKENHFGPTRLYSIADRLVFQFLQNEPIALEWSKFKLTDFEMEKIP